MSARPVVSELAPRALAFRIAHALFAVVQLTALAHVWNSAVRRRRDPKLGLSVGLLCLEGGALVIGRGNCPFGPFQRQLGDPVPLFELVLPPRAAKAAIPVLAVVALAGLALLAVRLWPWPWREARSLATETADGRAGARATADAG
jgi:hypothetical protein